MNEKKRKYAEFLLTRCLSMNKGEPLLLSYSTTSSDFATIVKEVAKELGINEIYEVVFDACKTREVLLTSSLEKIKKHPYFDRHVIKKVYDMGGSSLSLSSYEPNKLADVPLEKIRIMNKVKKDTQEDAIKARHLYKFPWCIAAVATKQWAEKLNIESEEKLWEIIFKCTLMDKDDPVKAWNEKIKINTERRNLLNELKLSKLKYKNSLGTNLEIGLPKDVIWWGAAKKSYDGKKDLIVNMPTEEVYTTPDKDKVNGVVFSSRPLVVKGTIIQSFKLIFKEGKVIDVHASNDEEKLLDMISEYDDMRYLGECALVDYDSPISKTNMIFNSTLIDENASCHLAIGNGFPKCVPNGEKMSDEELIKRGINVSKNHVDFMIGTSDLSIIGTDVYGNDVPIFVDGDFALEEVKTFLKERNDK